MKYPKVNLHQKFILNKTLARVVGFQVIWSMIVGTWRMREPNSSPSKLAKVLCCDRSNIDGFESESEDEEITNFYLMGRADIRESDESE